MPDPRADEHEGAVAVREAAHDARAPPDLPVEPFDHVAGAYPPAVPVRELRQQVRGRLADPPPRRQSAAAFSLPPSISAATCSALARAVSRDSMANTALNAAEAQSLWLGGVFESTLRMKCTMHRRHLASGSMGVDGGDGPRRTGHRPPI